jgi:hypothetical protein
MDTTEEGSAGQENVGSRTEDGPDASQPDMAEEDGSQFDSDEDDEQEDLDHMPSFEFRFETAKLLIELDENTDAAVQERSCLHPCVSRPELCGPV